MRHVNVIPDVDNNKLAVSETPESNLDKQDVVLFFSQNRAVFGFILAIDALHVDKRLPTTCCVEFGSSFIGQFFLMLKEFRGTESEK